MQNRAQQRGTWDKFEATQSDRSELGMSNATSSGLPGLGTIRAGIEIISPSKNKNLGKFEQSIREQSIREETLIR